MDRVRSLFKAICLIMPGSLGVEELIDPLLSLGIAETPEDVQRIIDSVDEDGSRKIEFGEFLLIISGAQESKGDSGIIDFFKDMIEGNIAGGQISNKLPFNLIISTVRRKKLMDSMMSKNPKDKVEGEKVMNSYTKLMATRKKDRTSESSQTKRRLTSKNNTIVSNSFLRPSSKNERNIGSLTGSFITSPPGSKRC